MSEPQMSHTELFTTGILLFNFGLIIMVSGSYFLKQRLIFDFTGAYSQETLEFQGDWKFREIFDVLQRLFLFKETLDILDILNTLNFISVQILNLYEAFKIQNMFYNEIVVLYEIFGSNKKAKFLVQQ